jgi:hypothetical protein
MTALSWHEPEAAPEAGVPGVPEEVRAGSGVPVGAAVWVGRASTDLVGGRVEVTNAGGASVAASWATFTQEARLRLMSRIQVQTFFIRRFYPGNIKDFCGGLRCGAARNEGISDAFRVPRGSRQGETVC